MTEYKLLSNGNKIPTLSFGTFLLSGQECIDAVITAIKIGYRSIDTAASYKNEQEVGFAIQKCIHDGIVKREELFIATKLNHHVCNSYEDTQAQISKSLELLDLAYIDMYLIHYPNVTPDERWKKINADSWKAMEAAVHDGKIRSLGISNFMPVHLEELLKTATIKPVYNQLNLSPQWPQNDVVRICKEHDILPVAWSTFLRPTKYNTPVIEPLEKKYGKSSAQITLRWAIQKGYAAITKSKTPSRIEENFNVFDFEIDGCDIVKLDELVCYPFCVCHPHATYHLWKAAEALENKFVVQEEKILLLKNIPFLTAEITNNIYVWKLFNFLPFLKIDKNDETHYKLYLFGKFRFAKLLKKRMFVEKVKLTPKWDEDRTIKKIYWDVFFERYYERITSFYPQWYTKKYDSLCYRILLRLRKRILKKISINSLDVHTTTHCTLKCKECSHKIPFFKEKDHHVMKFDEFKNNIDKILLSVDKIFNLLLLGGEPLLNKELDKMIQYACSKSQIKNVVIITNGTLLFSDSVLNALSVNSKAYVSISNYAKNTNIKNLKHSEIITQFKEKNIPYAMAQDGYWHKQPAINIDNKILDAAELNNNFHKCNFKHYTCLSNGKIYPCAMARYIESIDHTVESSEFIDLNCKNDLSAKFIKFYEKNFFDVCRACNFESYGDRIIAAQQLEKKD